MGTTSLRPDRKTDITGLPACVRSLLSSIEQHASHRAQEYYYPGFCQYFSDAQKAVSEIARVLRTAGQAFLVVQNSYFKELQVDLPQLYLAMGREASLDASIISSVVVERHRNKASVNPASRIHQNREYKECLVQLLKNQ
jgi:hypothetical protein